MTTRTSHMHGRAGRVAVALLGLGLALGGCVHDEPLAATTAGIPGDYRMRHPIAVEDANHSIVVFVGQGRGGLSAEQRADVMGLAQGWQHEGTGAISADVPVNTPCSPRPAFLRAASWCDAIIPRTRAISPRSA
jgi:pilus assembly protein CpaD